MLNTKELLAAFALSTVCSGAALAQAKPEVTVLIDASGRMQHRQDGAAPQCLAPDAVDPPAGDEAIRWRNRSKINVIKSALAGRSSFAPWCTTYDDAYRVAEHAYGSDGYAHSRNMCCDRLDAGRCTRYAPCGNDHGKLDPNANDATSLGMGEAFDSDGVIRRFRDRVKFGLMISDSLPGNPDLTSYGTDQATAQGAQVVVGAATRWGIALDRAGNPVGLNQEAVNMGIRSRADTMGRFVPGHRGVLDGNNQRFNVAVSEDVSSIRAHNNLVEQVVRDVIPYGHTPLSAMLRDAVEHYETMEAAGEDPAALCRRRVLVLITDGFETPYYGGERCQLAAPAFEPVPNAADCAQGAGTCMNQPVPVAGQPTLPKACLADADCDANNQELCRPLVVGGPNVCTVQACSYPGGWPYDKASAYAAELYERGVVTFVVGFHPTAVGQAHIERIAAAGAPGEGPDGRDGWFVARSEAQLRDALDRVVNSVFTELVVGQSPAIITPSAGDDIDPGNEDVRQWRLFSYAERLSPADTTLYGRVHAEAYGCPQNPLGDDDPSIERLSSYRFDQMLTARQTQRRTLSRNPLNGDTFAVTGAADSMFSADGTPRAGAAVNDADARTMTVAQDNNELQRVGQLFNGYFGNVGLPNGWNGAQGSRQLGAIESGNMAVIGAPKAGIQSPAYAEFLRAQRNRPSLMVTGARDGLVHIFRTKDGYEVMSFVPRIAWADARDGQFPADGPTNTGEVIDCRSLVDGAGGECPSEMNAASFRTLLVGGLGRGGPHGGANLYGVDLTNVVDIADEPQDANGMVVADLFTDGARRFVWNATTPNMGASTSVAKLGDTVSQPALTHVRVGDEIRGAVVAGCGEDPNAATARVANAAGVGRCVLVLDATDGSVISRFEDAAMDLPVVGSPVIYPADSLSPAERIYIGDAGGRLWRIDLRSPDVAQWRAAIAWPSAALNDPEFATAGRAIFGRPALTTRADGNVVLVFGQGEEGVPSNPPAQAHVVSFTDKLSFNNGNLVFEPTPNWVMPLRVGEYTTVAPVVRDGTVLMVTIDTPPAAAVCAPRRNRLYAMHYTDVMVDDEGDRDTYAREDGEALYVKPLLQRFDDQGRPAGEALSLVLPPGLTIAGMTIANTPSCREGEGPSTDVILSGSSDGGAGGQGAGGRARQSIEFPDNGQLNSVPFDSSVFVESSRVGLRICLNCDRNGRSVQGFSGRQAPFPSQVLFWGTGFTD